MGRMLHDARLAGRSFFRRPGFSLTVVATLALGIGATTLVFSVVHGVLLRPLGYADPGRLVMVFGELDETLGQARRPVAPGDLGDLVDAADRFEGFAGLWFQSQPLLGEGEAEKVETALVSSDFFRLMRVPMLHGRDFEADDQWVVILSHRLWRRRFGEDPAIVGRSIQLAGNTQTVVGVLPPRVDLRIPNTGHDLSDADLFIVMPPSVWRNEDRYQEWIRVVGRLASDVTVTEAQAQVDDVVREIRTNYEEKERLGFRLVVHPFREEIVGKARPALLILLGAVGFVLLIACGNVANLMLVRAQGRLQEVSVRAALGAGRRDIVRQMFAESALYAVVGGGAAVLLAAAGLELLRYLNPPGLPRAEEIGIHPMVLLFALGATLLAALLFGLAPVLYASRPNLMEALKQRSDAPPIGRRTSSALVTAEVALSIALLAGAGLLLRTFVELQRIDPGWDPDGVLTFAVTVPPGRQTPEEVSLFTREVEERLLGIPGVVAAGATHRLPLAGGLFSGPYATEEMAAAQVTEPEASYRSVTPAYFDAMGTRLIRGRPFHAGDADGVVIVDRKLAEEAWPGEDPIGKRVRSDPSMSDDPEWDEVVGVVEHMRHADLAQDHLGTIFFPVVEIGWPGMTFYFAARATVEPLTLVAPMRQAIRSIDPNAVIDNVLPMRGRVSDALAGERFLLALIGIFGGVALLMAAVGLYGVISFSVSRRTREIGIRVALGAERRAIARMVLGRGLQLAGAGVLLGLVAALALTRFLAGVLYGVGPIDPPTYLAVGLLLVGISLLACYVPSRRAAAVDPIVALRYE